MATSPRQSTKVASPPRTGVRLGLAALALAILFEDAGPASALESGTACAPSHGRAALARNDGAMVYDGDPARGFQLHPNRQETGPGGVWRNQFSFRPGVQITVVCSYADGHRYAFALSPTARACTQDAQSFACR